MLMAFFLLFNGRQFTPFDGVLLNQSTHCHSSLNRSPYTKHLLVASVIVLPFSCCCSSSSLCLWKSPVYFVISLQVSVWSICSRKCSPRSLCACVSVCEFTVFISHLLPLSLSLATVITEAIFYTIWPVSLLRCFEGHFVTCHLSLVSADREEHVFFSCLFFSIN